MIKDKASWKTQAASGTPLTVKRKLNAKHPEIDSEILNFLRVARKIRLPVTRQLMQERAKLTASSNGIIRFKGSNGYIEKFIRRSSVRSSVCSHAKGGWKPPANHLERMENLRPRASTYSLKNIYKVDEIGFLYWIGPLYSYLSPAETRRTVRGTELHKQKA